jgi:hypothetical protein
MSVTILDPVGSVSTETFPMALRPETLDGLRLGCLHNSKPGGEVLLSTIASQLQSDYQIKSVVWRRKQFPSSGATFLSRMATECDIVVAALAD